MDSNTSKTYYQKLVELVQANKLLINLLATPPRVSSTAALIAISQETKEGPTVGQINEPFYFKTFSNQKQKSKLIRFQK